MTDSRTVLMVSGNGPPVIDGVGHYTARLLARLSALRPQWRWEWLRRKRRWFTSPVTWRGDVTVVQPWHTWGKTGIRAAQQVVRTLRPAIVHVQEQTHSFHETAAAAEIVAAAPRVTVATIHEVHPELTGNQWTAEVVRRAEFVCANDAVTADKCRAEFGRTPDAIHWSPANVLPPTWTVPRRPGLVVTFGFLTSGKGLEKLFGILGQVRERVPGLRWRIVGPFLPDRDVHHARLAASLRANWVEFTGGRDDLDDWELRTWLEEASVMALPFVDGASARRTTLQSAWAFGIPVVTTPAAGGDLAVRHGMNCLTAPLDRPDLWQDLVESVLTNQELAAELAAGSRTTGERHSWDQLARAHLRLYDAALAGWPAERRNG